MNNIKQIEDNPCTVASCGINVERICPTSGECNDCDFFERWVLDSFSNKQKVYKHTEASRLKMSQARLGKRFPKATKK